MFYFLVPLLNIVCLCVFLNRIAGFEKLKNNANKYQNTISPKMVDSHNKKQTDHE